MQDRRQASLEQRHQSKERDSQPTSFFSKAVPQATIDLSGGIALFKTPIKSPKVEVNFQSSSGKKDIVEEGIKKDTWRVKESPPCSYRKLNTVEDRVNQREIQSKNLVNSLIIMRISESPLRGSVGPLARQALYPQNMAREVKKVKNIVSARGDGKAFSSKGNLGKAALMFLTMTSSNNPTITNSKAVNKTFTTPKKTKKAGKVKYLSWNASEYFGIERGTNENECYCV